MEALKLEYEGKIPKSSGYRCAHYNMGDEMVEYHINACEKFQERMNKETKYGGRLSVCLPVGKTPLIIFGHNKNIFKQYLVTKKSWVGPNGECALIPKNDVQSIMISSFQSRELGFELELLDEQLTEVNKA